MTIKELKEGAEGTKGDVIVTVTAQTEGWKEIAGKRNSAMYKAVDAAGTSSTIKVILDEKQEKGSIEVGKTYKMTFNVGAYTNSYGPQKSLTCWGRQKDGKPGFVVSEPEKDRVPEKSNTEPIRYNPDVEMKASDWLAKEFREAQKCLVHTCIMSTAKENKTDDEIMALCEKLYDWGISKHEQIYKMSATDIQDEIRKIEKEREQAVNDTNDVPF